MADALLELVQRARPSRDGADQTTVDGSAQITVTIRHADLSAPPGTRPRPGQLDLGLPVSVAAVRRLACDARVLPVVLGGAGQPLDIGRATRTVPAGLRRALAARDAGCAFPGCDRPPHWCHAHHIEHWADGGPTSLSNLVLLCGHHHRVIHHTGWEVGISLDGRPEFRPPAWIDPDRRPRRNLRFDPDGLDPP